MRPGEFAKPRPRNAPPGRFCPAGRRARGTGCSNPLFYRPIKSMQNKKSSTPQGAALGATGRIRTSGLPGRSRTLYPAELRSLIYEKRRYSVFQSCKEVNFQWWSIRGLTTVDHRFFASVNHAVSNKRKTKTCHVAVVGGQCSIQLSYDRIY